SGRSAAFVRIGHAEPAADERPRAVVLRKDQVVAVAISRAVRCGLLSGAVARRADRQGGGDERQDESRGERLQGLTPWKLRAVGSRGGGAGCANTGIDNRRNLLAAPWPPRAMGPHPF